MENENTADGTVETPIDWEARALKAEAKIVDLKKSAKPIVEEVVETKEEAPVIKEETETKTDEAPKQETTTKDETDVAALKAKLAELEAEKEIAENVKTTNMMGIGGQQVASAPSEYKMSDLENMSQAEYNKAKDLIDKGEATIIRD